MMWSVNGQMPHWRSQKVALMCLLLCLEVLYCDAVQFHYRRYPYRKKKDDKVYRNRRVKCDETLPVCKGLTGLQHTKCLRQCMSQPCYDELYAHDELEEGEIDVRLNSFKGCLASMNKR